jgi:hypothetical protein
VPLPSSELGALPVKYFACHTKAASPENFIARVCVSLYDVEIGTVVSLQKVDQKVSGLSIAY